MVRTHIIFTAGWILFGILHSILASGKFKRRMKTVMGRKFEFYRLYYILFAFAGFTALIFSLILIPTYRVFETNTATNVLGILFTGFGGVIILICIHKYFFQLSGLQYFLRERSGNQLMTTGIHKYVRHPLYAGTFIFIWGLWVLIPSLSLLISTIIITIYTLIGMRFEEQKLETEFGEAYHKYKREVPRIIPKF